MTADYDPTEAHRLIAEAREDDARMTPAPWSCDEEIAVVYGNADDHDGVEVACLGEEANNYDGDGLGIARFRNNLPAFADQLEAAGREVERIPDLQAAIGYEIEKRDAFERQRDSLRSQIQSEIHAHAASCARELAAIRERDALRKEVERLNADYATRGEHVLEVEDAATSAERERDSLRAALVKAKDEHTGDGLAWFEREHALTMERDSLRAEVERLEALRDTWSEGAVAVAAERDSLCRQLEAEGSIRESHIETATRTISGLTADLTAAQQAVVQGAESLAAAQREIAGLHALLKSNAEVYEATKRDHASGRMLLKATTQELVAMQRRIAELELDVAAQRDSKQFWTQDSALAHAALRAILPVYRAGHDWVYRGQGFRSALVASIHTARAAITPEIAAVLAGLERGE